MSTDNFARSVSQLDESHDPQRQSWVESASGHPEFPIQNLPMGVFQQGSQRRIGIAIGDEILDLQAAHKLGLLTDLSADVIAAIQTIALNAWMALPAFERTQLRKVASDSLLSIVPGASGCRVR